MELNNSTICSNVSSRIPQVEHGGWFPLAIAVIVFAISYVWHWGSTQRCLHSAKFGSQLEDVIVPETGGSDEDPQASLKFTLSCSGLRLWQSGWFSAVTLIAFISPSESYRQEFNKILHLAGSQTTLGECQNSAHVQVTAHSQHCAAPELFPPRPQLISGVEARPCLSH